jgi:hypothetical protein
MVARRICLTSVAALLSLLLFGCGEPTNAPQGGSAPQAQLPACRINSIVLTDVTKSKAGLTSCTAADYAARCDEGVTEQDNTCATQCALYKKRATAPATGDPCKANPVQSSTVPFSDQCKEVKTETTTTYSVACTVKATCTCDP